MMNDLENSVLQILNSHRGRHNPIPGRVIASLLWETSDRNIRVAIRNLIRSGHAIASATESPAGYYMAETWEEVNQYAQALRNRLIEDAKRRRDFLRATKTKVEPKQLELIVK